MLGENVTPTCVPFTMVLELQINKK